MNELISIIIPVFNRRKNLELTLYALEKQSDKDFEVIVVDDGSTDNTGNWLKKNKFPFDLKYHYMGENQGYRQCKARNMGVRLSNNSIGFVFLDSDVLLEPDTIEKYRKHYERNKHRVVCGMYFWGSPVETTKENIDDFPSLFKETRPNIPNAQPHGMQGVDIRLELFNSTTPDELHWKIGTYLSCFGGNLFVPRHIFMDVAQGQIEANPKENTNPYCGFDEHYTAPVEDGDFGLMLMKRGWAVSLDKTIYAYHVWHGRNLKQIKEVSDTQVKYLDEKYKINVLDETKIIQREEYKL